jgi:hypothetical protein
MLQQSTTAMGVQVVGLVLMVVLMGQGVQGSCNGGHYVASDGSKYDISSLSMYVITWLGGKEKKGRGEVEVGNKKRRRGKRRKE